MMNISNKIKSMGSNPMRDSFAALRDSCRDSGRDWFPILFFSARDMITRKRRIEISHRIWRRPLCLDIPPPIIHFRNTIEFFDSLSQEKKIVSRSTTKDTEHEVEESRSISSTFACTFPRDEDAILNSTVTRQLCDRCHFVCQIWIFCFIHRKNCEEMQQPIKFYGTT